MQNRSYALIHYPLLQKVKLLLVVTFCIAVSGAAQNSIGRLSELSLKKNVPFTVTQFSTKDGLTQSQIIDIVENSDGSLFLSTANGISTFNGYEFKELPINKEYRSHFFDHLYWSKKYKILYGKDYNTSRIVQLLPEYKVIHTPDAFFFSSSRNDSLFLSDYKNQLYYAALPGFTISKLNCTIPANITSIYYYNRNVYCTTSSGLYAYNIGTHITRKISNDTIYRLKADPYTHQLYGMDVSCVYIIGDSVKKILDTHAKGRLDACTDIEFLNDSEFYLSTRQGLFYVCPDYTAHYTAADGLNSETISALFYNKTENCLFAGTGEKGLLKLKFKNAFTIFKPEGLTKTSLNSIIKTTDGKVLISENCCTIQQLKIDTVIDYSPVPGDHSCMAEINNEIYCGTWGAGIQIMHGDKAPTWVRQPAIPGDIAFAIYKDKTGDIWVGTNKGVAKGKSAETITPVFSSQITSKIVCIYELRNGNICLGGDKGFFIVSAKGIEKIIGKKEGLISKEVRSFLEDAEGKLWIGTYGGGVYCYDNGKLTSINTMKNCMLFEDAFCLALDNFGQLFMTSNFGLWKVPYKALDDFYKHKTDYLIPEHYTQESGILNTEFNGGFQNNFLKTKQDHFYFPTIEGIVVVTPDTPTVRKLIPKIELNVKNEIQNDSAPHIFKRDVSVINFKASCVNFSDQFNVYFQYKVLKENEETEWSAPQKESLFSFYQLPPGNYKFVIRAIDGGNDKNPVEKTFAFRILPYFYETSWFKITMVLLILAFTVLIIRWRTKKNKDLLEKENAIKRQLAELQLEGIQAQMNPHFVFNCLNTIQALFITGDIKLANEYTSRFSSLMRLIIEHIRKRKISVREEMELLEIYLPLENIQMEIPFEYTISVEPDIDKDNTLIHGMIIHTFVENAIKHGIKPLHDKQGIIDINFKKENSNIVVEIIDNGNGINNSVKKTKDGKHISRGLQIIKERINIINLLENINIYTETFDLNDIDKTRTGTLVRIIYPQYDTNINS